MAFTLTTTQIATAIRAGHEGISLPNDVEIVLDILVPAAEAMIIDYAGGAPDSVHDMALVRLVGYLYDSDPADPRASTNPMLASGAAPLLSPWKIHRALSISEGGAEPSGGADGGGGNVPDPPALGSYVLFSSDSDIRWIPFPLPTP